MSLTGSLEDLPLLDILQIVSFSKKTGWLGIDTREGSGAIVFDEGFVVASFAWNVTSLPADFAALARDAKDTQIRRRIETALEQLIRLREGQFQFSLSERPPKTIGSRDISLETLEHGINPQELLLDLARGMDEDRRDSSAALEAGFSEAPSSTPEPPAPEAAPVEPALAPPAEAPPPPVSALPEHVSIANLRPEYTVPLHAIPEAMLKAHAAPAATPEPAPEMASAAPAEIQALLLVDDEEDVRRVLAQVFTHGGYQVVEAEDPEAAVKKASRLSKAGISFVLVTDLAMPTSGGSSFQGGFEVVKRLVKMKLEPPVLMMTESLSPAVRARAKQMNIGSFVFKPSLSKLDPEQYEKDLREFAGRLLADLIPGLTRQEKARKPQAAARPQASAAPSAHDGGARDLRVLQHHLQELRGSADLTVIATLVMKVAREFFERGALFLIKNEEVRGLGGFGPAGAGASANAVVREILVPLSEPSMFLDVVSSAKPWQGEADGRWSGEVMERLGRFRSRRVALFPLMAHRDTIAILFGDNPETGREFGRLEALELFVQQAGIAMENTLLQRKLRAVQEKG